MKIYFDMDGTLNHFYKGEWLQDILAENTRPYEIADCVIDESILLALQIRGYELCIISWLARGSSKDYDKRTRKAKRDWLKRYYPSIDFDEIHIVKYGTPKWKVANDRNGILFDDEERNRNAWRGMAFEPSMIVAFAD